jgi:hypothetical protein
MSTSATVRMLAPFIETAPAPMFLSGWFKTGPQNIHSSEAVELDVQRDGEDVAIVVVDNAGGHRENENEKYTNKLFVPPKFDEEMPINAHTLLKRNPGEDPFTSPDFQATMILRAFNGFTKLQNKIRRGIELMCSQVLQTGIITALNAAGTTVFSMSFAPKGTHFVTPTAWPATGGTGAPITDLSSLADVIRSDGHSNPDTLIFGQGAWIRFLNDAGVQKYLIRDGLGLGQLNAQARGMGATFQGFVTVGAYQFQCWTYNGTYRHPQTGTPTRYVGDNKVVMLSSAARLELSFGAIPIIMPERRVLQLPSRISDGARGIDLTVHSWLENGGKQLVVSAGTRPLPIPVEIDSFGCLTVF